MNLRLQALLVIFTALTACSSTPEQPRIEIDAAIVGTDYNSISYPLARYEFTEEQTQTINYARAILIRRCLLRFGIDKPLPSDILGKPHKLINDRHGLTDERHAIEWGYRQKPPPNNTVLYEFTLPDNAYPILYGRNTSDPTVPEGGCFGEATRALHGSSNVTTRDIAVELAMQARDKAKMDPTVVSLVEKWRECVRAHGFNYSTPHDAVRYWNTGEGAHGRPSQEEINAALIDVRCKQEHKLPNVWAAVEVGYQQRLIDENAVQLQERLALQEAWLRNAAVASSRGGS